jgi:chemosensory pili system protein ChpA (sensor histidine kinase/response regulator)
MSVDFDSLDAAAVALLEPVVVPDPHWRESLAAALDTFGDEARRAGLEPLSALASQLRGRLQRHADAQSRAVPLAAADALAEDEALRAVAGAWAADLLDLCAGRLDAAQAASLAEADTALAERLAALARRLAALRDVAPEPGRAVNAGEPVFEEAAAGTVARDELEMLADEAELLLDELRDLEGESADGLGEDRVGEEDDQASEAPATVLADGLRRLAAAAELVGLEPLAGVLRFRADDIGRRMRLPAQAFAAIDDMLAGLPEALAQLFRSAGGDRRALALLGAAGWPRRLEPHMLEAAHRQFDSLRLVGSRQIEWPAASDGAPDLSLTIPSEADSSVVDSLLRELPLLSAQLGERIGALGAGERDDVIAAQRLAHTLKGSANTVGVRGIAAITHRLEDLLQLVAALPGRLPPELRALLDDAADCVAEMCEAVAGLGAAPANAAAIHARIGDWIGRLLAGEGAAEMPAGDGDSLGQAVEIAGPDETGVVAADAAELSPGAIASTSGELEIRVPASLVGRLLDLVDEAAILVAHAREQALELERSRATMRLGGDQLQDLASELERLVDIREMALSERRARHSSDSLELDEYNDLHTVSRRIAESGADGKLVEQQLGSNLAALRDSLARLERLQAELRDCALRTRMAAFGSIAPRLQRTVRQAARMAGREVMLAIDGDDTLVEAGMLSTLVDALAHLLRNAVDHAIEPPELRRSLGKSPVGAIRLSVRRDGASLTVVCEDDGSGLDSKAIRDRAIAQGLLDPAAPADEAALQALILMPGFSTRDRVSQLSGRGFGLDVVSQTVRAMRGTIAIASEPGRGTRFTLAVPLGLASLPVMLVRSATHALALSVRGIDRIVPAPAAEPGGGATGPAGRPRVPAIHADGSDWTPLTLEALLGLPDDALEPTDVAGAAPAARSALLLRAVDGARTALLVPEPEAPRSVVVRPMPAHVPRVPGIDGVAVLGDGAVAPVLDLGALLAARADGSLGARAAAPARRPAAARTAPLCLVVDDSVSVRRTTEIFVRDLGFEVDGASDGVEALERVRRRVPDLMLVDMEMPRMNGLELVRALRADPRTANVAVIMITSRYSDRHKQFALDAGVDVFLTKPYTEDALASQIHACLERRPASGLSGVSRMG